MEYNFSIAPFTNPDPVQQQFFPAIDLKCLAAIGDQFGRRPEPDAIEGIPDRQGTIGRPIQLGRPLVPVKRPAQIETVGKRIIILRAKAICQMAVGK